MSLFDRLKNSAALEEKHLAEAEAAMAGAKVEEVVHTCICQTCSKARARVGTVSVP
jgi:hypothetical protein